MNIKIPPCLTPYLKTTRTGDRNNNLFNAMKKIHELNPEYSRVTLYQTCEKLNKNLTEPLIKRELRAITRSVVKHKYKSSCYPFKQYCKACKYGNIKKQWNTSKKNMRK